MTPVDWKAAFIREMRRADELERIVKELEATILRLQKGKAA